MIERRPNEQFHQKSYQYTARAALKIRLKQGRGIPRPYAKPILN